MKANELRIGNLFLYENCIYIAKVIRVDFVYGINRNGFAPGEFPIEIIKPIQITTEILLACGLNDWIIDNRFECRHNNNNSVSIYAWKTGKSIFIIDLFYLHDLQNWYLLHSKQELDIQL